MKSPDDERDLREEEEPPATKSDQPAKEKVELEEEKAAAEEPAVPQSFATRIRQIVQRSAQGEARTQIKRQQLREDRTKAFLLLGGSVVALALVFFALFSAPSSSRRNSARSNQPHLGRPDEADTDQRSVTPLLNADTRKSETDSQLSPDDIRNTARVRTQAQSNSAPPPPPPAKDYALNQIQFPTEPQAQPVTPQPEKLSKNTSSGCH